MKIFPLSTFSNRTIQRDSETRKEMLFDLSCIYWNSLWSCLAIFLIKIRRYIKLRVTRSYTWMWQRESVKLYLSWMEYDAKHITIRTRFFPLPLSWDRILGYGIRNWMNFFSSPEILFTIQTSKWFWERKNKRRLLTVSRRHLNVGVAHFS